MDEPQFDRRAIMPDRLRDLSVSEIAEEADSPIGTVRARRARGRRALARLVTTEPEVRHA